MGYAAKEAETEEQLRAELIDKHNEEQLQLEELQGMEKKRLLEEYLPNSLLKDFLLQESELLNEELEDFKEEKRLEKERKMREIDEKKRSLQEEMDLVMKERKDLDNFEEELLKRQQEIERSRRQRN